MYPDNALHISLGIVAAHRQADLERSFRRGRTMEPQAVGPTIQRRPAVQAAAAVSAVTAPDAALIAAGERSDALLTPASGPRLTADRAA